MPRPTSLAGLMADIRCAVLSAHEGLIDWRDARALVSAAIRDWRASRV